MLRSTTSSYQHNFDNAEAWEPVECEFPECVESELDELNVSSAECVESELDELNVMTLNVSLLNVLNLN